MFRPVLFGAVASVVAGCALCGCGASSPTKNCGYSFVVNVMPAAGSAIHAAAPPANQVQFVGTAVATAAPGCPVPALARLEYAAWTNPDPTDIQISSANDATNGMAVCKGTTKGAVTLTGVFSPVTLTGSPGSGDDTETKTVELTCK